MERIEKKEVERPWGQGMLQDGCGVEIENRRVPAKTCPILQTHGDVDDIVDIGQMHKMKAAISGSWI